jgi:hypothetical protein
MYDLIASISNNVTHLITSNDPKGVLCVAGIIYTVFLLVLGWCGWAGWVAAVGISITCFFMFTPTDPGQYCARVTINGQKTWITQDDVLRGRYIDETQMKKVIETNDYYFKPHVDGRYSWRLYHPVIWMMAPLIGLGLSPFTWIVFAITITFGGAGNKS